MLAMLLASLLTRGLVFSGSVDTSASARDRFLAYSRSLGVGMGVFFVPRTWTSAPAPGFNDERCPLPASGSFSYGDVVCGGAVEGPAAVAIRCSAKKVCLCIPRTVGL